MNTYSFNPHTRHFIGHVCTGEFAEAKAILAAHPSIVTDRNSSGESPLHWLVIENEMEGVEMLLAHGADPDARDFDGDFALSDVAGLGLTQMLVRLLEAGADVSSRHPRSQETALHIAANYSPEPTIADLLVDAGADIEARDHFAETPLHHAAFMGNIEIAERLLRLGADPAAKNAWGHSVLDKLSSDTSDDERSAWQSLLSNGPDGIARRPRNQRAEFAGDTTPTSQPRDDDRISDPIDDPSAHAATTDESFDPPTSAFINAIMRQDLAEAETLLNAHPEIVTDRNDFDETPLHWLAIEDQFESVKLLLSHAAHANCRSRSGNCVLGDAASLGLARIVKALLAAGVVVDSKHDHSRETPLHLAARHATEPAVIDLLIDAGADTEAINMIDETPLMVACLFDNRPAGMRLMDRGARPPTPNELSAFGFILDYRVEEVRAAWRAIFKTG